MAQVTVPGGVPTFPTLVPKEHSATTIATIDAAGESVACIGIARLATGPGTSKTLSSSGGKIFWVPGTTTFAQAGTTLRVGLQEVATGLEDGSWTVYDDLVGGTDTITAGVINTATMSAGAGNSIADGQQLAVVIEATARQSADSIIVRGILAPDFITSYISVDSGSGPAKVTGTMGLVGFTTDDGTVGWIEGGYPFAASATTLNNSNTPDEVANLVSIPFATTIIGISIALDNVASTDTFDLVLYSTPLGTPGEERTITADPNLLNSATGDGMFNYYFSSAYTPALNTQYAIAFRPTSANDITYYTFALGTGLSANRAALPWFGTGWSGGTRSNVTGAFSESTVTVYGIGPILGSFSDGAGSGGGMIVHPGMRGRLV